MLGGGGRRDETENAERYRVKNKIGIIGMDEMERRCSNNGTRSSRHHRRKRPYLLCRACVETGVRGASRCRGNQSIDIAHSPFYASRVRAALPPERRCRVGGVSE